MTFQTQALTLAESQHAAMTRFMIRPLVDVDGLYIFIYTAVRENL